jgi:CDP-glucose 4,6-dehydratase
MFVAAKVAEGMTSIIADIRDLDQLRKCIAEHNPEIIFHMAAQTLVRYSYVHPVETYSTNVMGTVNVLEAVRRSEGVRVVVNITSDKCYENREWVWGYRENDTLGGHDPYSSSKGCAELVTSAYRDSYFPLDDYQRHGVAVASARAGNVIGGGDWAEDRLIPDMMKAFLENRSVIIRNPDAVRPWQYVLEPLSGYLLLAELLWLYGPDFSQGWNFGPNDNDAKPVSWIVENLAAIWGNGAKWELDSSENPHESHYLKLDCSKARRELNWVPRLWLNRALQWTAEWYLSYRENENMRQVTEEQIARYENLGTE